MTKYGAQNMQISFDYFGAWNQYYTFQSPYEFLVASVASL